MIPFMSVMIVENKSKLSAFSFEFLRPLFRSLKQGNVVLLRVVYSRQGGNSDLFAIETESRLKTILRKLPKETAVWWWDIEEPEWRMNPHAYVPTNGKVIKGAY
jgi:hypothetical protein